MVGSGGSGGVKRKGNMLDSDSDGGSGSGSDLEQEMLLLSKKKKAGSPLPAPEPKKAKEMSDSDSSGSDSDWGLKAKNKKTKKKKSSIRKSSVSHNSTVGSDEQDDDKSDEETFPPAKSDETPKKVTASDLEEGEVSSSDSDDESSDAEFDDGYDENLMGDEEDKKRLSEMTEKEREQEIFKRVENREIKKTRYEIEKKLKQARKKERKKEKKSDNLMSKFKMDAKERSKERKKTVEGRTDKKSQAMDLLKAKREARKEREEEKEKQRLEQEKLREEMTAAAGEEDFDMKDDMSSTITERSMKKKLKASDIYSDDSGSDVETGSTMKVKRERDGSSSSSDSDSESDHKKPVIITNNQQLSRLRLSRLKIEKWLHYPFFNTLAKGMFVRLGIGHNPKEQKSVYRIAEVIDVVETPKIYKLGNNVRTNKGFRLRHGLDERVFRLEFISSQEFKEDEFLKWLEACHNSNVSPPTMQDVEKKEAELREASNYQFKDSDVEHIIQEKQRFKQSPVNFAVRKTQLMKEKETAQQRGDDMRVEEIAREIAELDERAKELDKARSQSIQSISYINERNRKKNVEKAEIAIMEELKESRGKKVEDPFTRRNTKPMPMVVNRLTPGGISTPGQLSPRTPDTSFNTSSVKPDVDEVQEINTNDDIKNEDLLRRRVGDDDENENTENTSVVTELLQSTPAALEEKAVLKLLPLEAIDITAPLKIDGADMMDGKSKKVLTTNDLFSAHDFDINLELDAKLPLNLPVVARPSIPPIREPAPRRSLNLDDYKRKRGLI